MGLFRRKKADESSHNNEAAEAQPGHAKKKKGYHKRFAQQDLWGWSPIITGNVVVIYFFLAGVVCLALGVPILLASLGIVEVKARYDDVGVMAGQSLAEQQRIIGSTNGRGVPATVNLTIPRDMQPPIYVYYELHRFYQNYKRYVRSRDDRQMGGAASASAACQPEQYVGGRVNHSLPNDGLINPCGLIAWSFFNDTFALSGANQQIDESHIAWSSDRQRLYGNYKPVNYNNIPEYRGGNTSTLNVSHNEHLMVWLRPAARPTFRKLWGVLHQPLAAGTNLEVRIINRFNTYAYGGQKVFILSTNSWLGGKNLFLGIIYLVVSGLAFLTCFAFFFVYHLECFGLLKRRKFGDLSQLSWNKAHVGR